MPWSTCWAVTKVFQRSLVLVLGVSFFKQLFVLPNSYLLTCLSKSMTYRYTQSSVMHCLVIGEQKEL